MTGLFHSISFDHGHSLDSVLHSDVVVNRSGPYYQSLELDLAEQNHVGKLTKHPMFFATLESRKEWKFRTLHLQNQQMLQEELIEPLAHEATDPEHQIVLH